METPHRPHRPHRNRIATPCPPEDPQTTAEDGAPGFLVGATVPQGALPERRKAGQIADVTKTVLAAAGLSAEEAPRVWCWRLPRHRLGAPADRAAGEAPQAGLRPGGRLSPAASPARRGTWCARRMCQLSANPLGAPSR
ncbi:hypothetical protein EASAB2608_00463 [Streptomyces sp. EAS-AB2608]|nr:hypothetical protein EASAB2608_00463 [Streptomyces sp. EAS-AB2608]